MKIRIESRPLSSNEEDYLLFLAAIWVVGGFIATMAVGNGYTARSWRNPVFEPMLIIWLAPIALYLLGGFIYLLSKIRLPFAVEIERKEKAAKVQPMTPAELAEHERSVGIEPLE